jgi:hypothetical protein
MSNKQSRKATLTELIAAGALTPEGKNWLIEATDPFHDEQITLAGFPDMNVSASIVQCIKSTQTLKKPAAITDTGNWDANIALWPIPNQVADSGKQWTTDTGTTPSSQSNYLLGSLPEFTSDMGVFPIGGCTAYCVPAGEDTYGGEVPAGGYDAEEITLSLPTQFMRGGSRIIGMGFEVINTTAPLYKQGEVIVYRQPNPQPDQKYTAYFYSYQDPELLARMKKAQKDPKFTPELKALERAIKGMWDPQRKDNPPGRIRREMAMQREFREKWGLQTTRMETELTKFEKEYGGEQVPAPSGWERTMYASTYALTAPPGSAAQAKFLAGSQQWEAEKGAYCVATMNTLDNPSKFQEPQMVIAWDQYVENGLGSGLGIGTGWTQMDTIFASVIMFPPTLLIAPFNTAGMYFLGLSPQTTLSVNVNWYIERFPDPKEEDLVVMASPSPGFDATAMHIYAEAMRRLPVGVPQGMNPLGEWFNSVVNSVAKVVAPALKTAGIANPLMSGLGYLADQVAAATEVAPVKAQQRKKKAPGGPARPNVNQTRKRKQRGKTLTSAPPRPPRPALPAPGHTLVRNRRKLNTLE